jgi:hypothetical protein
MSNFQTPEILTDLYRDLRDRRLLPLAVVLIAGLAIVPIALSSKSKTAPVPAPPPPPQVTKSNAPTSTVVVSNPGVRNYKRRLAHGVKSPFRTPGFAKVTSTATSSSGSAAATTSTTSAPSGISTSGTSTPSGSVPSGGSSSPVQVQSKFYFYRVKVRAGIAGGNLKVHDNVGALTVLPDKNAQVAEFLGVNTDSAFKPVNAVFLVNSAVTTVSGTGHCSFAGTSCQVVSLKPGQHEDFVWTNGISYRIELVKFDLVARNSLPSASGQGSSGGGGGGSTPGRNAVGRHFTF